MGWGLESFDIKAAFLQGQPLYGLIDAPYLWYCALVTELIKLGFEPTPFDPCLFVIRNPPDDEKAGSLAWNPGNSRRRWNRWRQ